VNRRALLSAAAAGLAGLAGCAEVPGRSTPTPTATETPREGKPLAERGSPSDLCSRDIVDLGIPAIDEPEFAADWSGVDVGEDYSETGALGDGKVVIGLEADGEARAYPIAVLWHHEIVNDVFDALGGPVLVTFCPLCSSGMVARRLVDGEPTKFGVSGQLWRAPGLYATAAESSDTTFAAGREDPDPGEVRNAGNLVMFDIATGSFWSQLLARGLCGSKRGTELEILPSTTAKWGDWRADHPDTELLLPPPASGTLELPF